MALGVLFIFYLVLISVAVILQFLLYKSKYKSSNGIFIINMLFVIFLTYLAYTALPTNYTIQKSIAIFWASFAVLAVVLKLITGKSSVVSRVILSLSIIGSFLQLYF